MKSIKSLNWDDIVYSKGGFVENLFLDGEDIVLPWGVETSDSAGFFSLEEGGCRSKLIHKEILKGDGFIKAQLEVELPFSKWRLDINERIKSGCLLRKNKLTCLEECQFNDFVSRFRFKKKFVKSVEISNKKLFHADSNIYYQYPVKKVILNLTSGRRVIIKMDSYKTIPHLEPVMYARDAPGEWVIHARLFPKNAKIKQIKILRSWYNKAIPQWMSNVLLKIGPLKNFLWYRGERKGYFPLGAYGLIKGKKGDVLELKTTVELK